jgi:hypothetical protein
METVLQEKSAAPNPVRARKPRKQQPKLDLSRFNDCSLMYLQIGEVVLWNNASAMRKNGNFPSEVAKTLCQDFGVRLGEDPRKKRRKRQPNQAIFDYFAALVSPDGSPSILDGHRGHA